ncbi:MAG: hypothetical protein M0R77_00980 [Gammaproteobacteria bacterium]|nr:hypothetical protein [Acholeplasmataceae bacterium]MCK9529129.1 hypothetical protein [Gammaproteobacteria bacterium]
MDKKTYFLTALNNNAHYNTNWVINAFSKTDEKPDVWQYDPYPYRLVKTKEMVGFVDPNNGNALTPITDINNENWQDALYEHTDTLSLKAGDYKDIITEDIETTYGQLLVNAIMYFCFTGRIPYNNKPHLNAKDFEKAIPALLQPLPPPGVERNPQHLYYDDVERYFQAVFMFSEFALLFTPGDTEKSLRSIPGMKEKRDELFAKYEGQLHIPAVEAAISKELEALDKAYRKGDPSEGLLTAGKDVSVIRKKLYMFTGKEGGLVVDPKATPIKQSLSEGWDLTRFTDYANNIRSGSYSRGVETALGGELAKWLLRAFSNANVVGDDCGTRFGLPIEISNLTSKELIGFYYIDETDAKTKPITEEVTEQYLGKVLQVRSPIYCTKKHTDYCATCVGVKQAADPTSIGSAITAIGNRFMNIVMKSMHGTALATTKYDPKKQLM